MEGPPNEDRLAEALARIRTEESKSSRLRSVFVIAPLLLGVAVLAFYSIQLSKLVQKERAARHLADKSAEKATENAKTANDEREKAQQANAQLKLLIDELQRGQTKVPANAGALAICVGLVQQGDDLRKSGELVEAEKAYDLARDCQAKLAEKSNDNELRFQLSSTLNSLGSVRLASKNFRGAFAAFEEALKIREQLSALPKADERWKLGKFYSLLYTSDAARIFDPPKALSLAREALLFAENLAAGNADSDWRKALSIAQEQVKRLETKTKD